LKARYFTEDGGLDLRENPGKGVERMIRTSW